ncbi:ABC transporter permease [Gabonibacter chumensis]|uniref:ABC transporter permease n=1 Tax=Gabonibacter chumensis TaxID=2972474 RepID=UPI002573661F|nr:ABC transporter permease [Gabonibacter chumensis]MCR9011264.1 ABC transporter permease [Gabonibacter chumensis]
MNLSVFIARRYLFSKKKQNAINIISIISMIGVAIGTAALIVVLSVFNGIDLLLTDATDSFTPDITVSPVKGKFFKTDSLLIKTLKHMEGIRSYDPVIEEKALVKYGKKLMPVTVKGVDKNYNKHTGIDHTISTGKYSLKEGDKYTAVLGYSIAATLKLRIGLTTPMTFYYPDKNSSSAASSLNSENIFPIALFSAQQDIDGKYVITDIDFARTLFMVPGEISQIEIKLNDPDRISNIKAELKNAINQQQYKVEDKYDTNRSFYAMMKSEKLAIFLILLFILLIASFNIIGSVSMLIIDKKEDIGIYQALGMSREKIISIFKLEGNLITGIGALFGLIVGSLLCLGQEHFGWITLGEGNYMIDAYPVKLIGHDILIILISVIAIGYLASHFPVKYLIRKIVKN